jgi:hypothetical protein
MKLDYFNEAFCARIKCLVIHNRPEFKGLQKTGNILPLAVIDDQGFEHQTEQNL